MIKPVNLEALSKWVGNIPEDVVHDMANIAPMLSILGECLQCWNDNFVRVLSCLLIGYDPYANPPNYGSADEVVKENTNKVRDEKGSLFSVDSFKLICWLGCLSILSLNGSLSSQVKKNQKLWDTKVKQLLKREEENNEENDDNQDDNPNDAERTWWGEWVNKFSSSHPKRLSKWKENCNS